MNRAGQASVSLDGPPERWALAAWFRIGSQYLLSVCGRKSGVIRSTPVSIATVRGERFIVAAFADAAVVGNVRHGGGGTLGRGRTKERVRLVELPVEKRDPVLRAFLEQVRGGVRFFGSSDPNVVAAAADRYPVFRVDSN